MKWYGSEAQRKMSHYDYPRKGLFTTKGTLKGEAKEKPLDRYIPNRCGIIEVKPKTKHPQLQVEEPSRNSRHSSGGDQPGLCK